VDGSGRTKPDIVAPGDDVLSSTPDGTYATASGTSMAGPHVAGVVALVWSANPALIGDIARTEALLRDTAAPYTGDGGLECAGSAPGSNVYGFGVVDAYAAVQAALALR
jgi:subtilisin family serine protease